MLHLLERAADRMVGVVVPKTTAGACECSARDNYWGFCYCGSPPGTPYYHLHQVDCWCNETVGPCVKHITNICL